MKMKIKLLSAGEEGPSPFEVPNSWVRSGAGRSALRMLGLSAGYVSVCVEVCKSKTFHVVSNGVEEFYPETEVYNFLAEFTPDNVICVNGFYLDIVSVKNWFALVMNQFRYCNAVTVSFREEYGIPLEDVSDWIFTDSDYRARKFPRD